MLDEKRIKEAESNVRQYLDEGLLKKATNETAKKMNVENKIIITKKIHNYTKKVINYKT